MKCPKCGGYGKLLKKEKGKSCYEVSLSFCDKCHGSGEVEATNEEWLNNLSTEKKAEFLDGIARDGGDAIKRSNKSLIVYKHNFWEEWLKQPHKE